MKRRRVIFNAKRITFAIIGLTLATMLGTLASSLASSHAAATFDFFRLVEKPSTEKTDQLQSVKIERRGKSFAIYTERKPSYKMPLSEIISITIERDIGLDELYKTTFSISRPEKRRFDEFANVNDQQRFDFRFGDRRLGTVQFVGRFGGSESKPEFTTFLEPRAVKEVFGSLKEKVVWKE
jgi:hypothetical protein